MPHKQTEDSPDLVAGMIAPDEGIHRDLETGLNTLADAARVTLGSKGCNAVLEHEWGVPLITNDGVSIACGIELEDPYKKIGAEPAKKATKRTDDVVGDGTTTATVLAQALVFEGLCSVTAGSSLISIERGTEKAIAAVIERLLEFAKDIETKGQIAVTAGISVADPTIGELIAVAIDKTGKEGIIAVEEANTFGLDLELTEGMRFDKDYISGYLATDMKCQEAALEGPYILLISGKISSTKDLLPLLEKVMQSGKSPLITVEGVEGGAPPVLVVSKIRGIFKSVATRAPGFGDRCKVMLQDTAILTDGQVIPEEVGSLLETASLSLLGHARKVIVTKDETIIVEGAGDQSTVEGRVSQIRAEIENSSSNYDKEKPQERLTKLTGDAAVIKAGAATEVELEERKHHTEDAVRNTKATVGEGIVAGGGPTLLQVSYVLDDELGPTDDETTGVRIVRATLATPLRWIALNADLEAGVITEKAASLPQGEGLNTAIDEYINLMEVGINDPVKVTCSALQSATSIVALFPTTEAVVVDKPEPAMPTMPGGDKIGGMGF